MPSSCHRVPGIRPFEMIAVWHVPIVGEVVAHWYEGFDPRQAEWFDVHTGQRILAFPSEFDPGIGQSLGQALARVWHSPQRGALAPDGGLCGVKTRGVLQPAPTQVTGVRIIGKEARHRGVGRGTISRPEYVLYGRDDDWPLYGAALAVMAKDPSERRALADEAGVGLRTIEYLLAGRTPAPRTRSLLAPVIYDRAEESLRRVSPWARLPGDSRSMLAHYLAIPVDRLRCESCKRELPPRRRRWCSDACRKRANREASERTGLPPRPPEQVQFALSDPDEIG